MAGLRRALTRAVDKGTRDIIQDYRAKGADPDAPSVESLQDIELNPDIPSEGPPVVLDGTTEVPPSTAAPEATPEAGPVEAAPQPGAAPDVSPLPPVGADEAQRVLDELPAEPVPDPLAAKRTPGRPTNIQRHHEGAIADMDPTVSMANMQSADDMGRLLNIVARGDKSAPTVQTQASIEAQIATPEQVAEVLGPVFKGKVNGNLTAVQLGAARKMLATLSDDVIKLANKIAEGDKRAEVLLQYERRANNFIALQRYLQGEVREVARALAQQNMIAKTLRNGGLDSLTDMLSMTGSNPETIARAATNVAARAKAAGPNTPATHTVADAMQDKWRTRQGAMVDFFKNNILSGFATHAVNVLGNAVLNIHENVLVHSLAAVSGAVRHAIPEAMVPENLRSKAMDRVYASEQLPVLIASTRGLFDGFLAFARMLVTEKSDFAGAKVPEQGRIAKAIESVGAGPKVARGIEVAATGSFRALGAEDELFKTLAFRQNIERLLWRSGMTKGLRGDDLQDFIDATVNDPPEDIMNEAFKASRDVTLTATGVKGAIGTLSQSLRMLVSNHPFMGFLMPFIQTPANLLAKGVDNSILSVVSPRLWSEFNAGGAKRDVAVAKMTLGAAQTAAIYQLYEAGMITGGGPDDPRLRQHLEDSTGWKPYAVRVGDSYFSLKRLDPFAMALAPVLAIMDSAKYASQQQTFEAMMKGAAFKIANHALDSSWLTGIASLVAAVQGRETQQDRTIGNIVGGLLIPYSSALNDIRKVGIPGVVGADPQQRRTSRDPKSQDWKGVYYYTKQMMKGRIPGVSVQLRPARMWDGKQRLPVSGVPAWALSPVAVSDAKDWNTADKALFTNAVTPREPAANVSIGPISFSLLELDAGKGSYVYDAYIQEVGKQRRLAVEQVVRTPEFKKLDQGPGSRGDLVLRDALRRGADAGHGKFFFDGGLRRAVAKFKADFPDEYNPLTTRLLGDISRFIELAGEGRLPATIKGKVKVQGRGPSGALPVPQQTETGPSF